MFKTYSAFSRIVNPSISRFKKASSRLFFEHGETKGRFSDSPFVFNSHCPKGAKIARDATEVFEVTHANGYRIHTMPDIGTVEYPLAFYSVLSAYQIRIAMSEAHGELDASMFGTGSLMQYDADLFESGDIQRLSLNEIPAFRIDHIAAGSQGEITMHIIAVVDDRMIEIIVEPIAEVGGTAIEGLEIVNQIIGSIKLESFME